MRRQFSHARRPFKSRYGWSIGFMVKPAHKLVSALEAVAEAAAAELAANRL